MSDWRFLIWTVLFLSGALGVTGLLMPLIIPIFTSNIALNAFILVAFLGGLCWGILMLLRVTRATQSLHVWQEDRGGVSQRFERNILSVPSFLKPLLPVLETHHPLTASRAQAFQDTFHTFFETSHEALRYLMGGLVFLGLLGTFFGLSVTIQGISDVISQLSTQDVGAGDRFFEDLKLSLQKPLGGMGTAFGASLFGIATSLVLGFVELQVASQGAYFLKKLETFLASITQTESGTRLSPHRDMPAGPFSQSYLETLLGEMNEHLEKLHQSLHATEVERYHFYEMLNGLGEKIGMLIAHIQQDHPLLLKLSEGQVAATQQIKEMVKAVDVRSFDEILKRQTADFDQLLRSVLDCLEGVQLKSFQDLKQEFRLFTKTFSHTMEKYISLPREP